MSYNTWDILRGWDAIAEHMGRGRSTVIRWATEDVEDPLPYTKPHGQVLASKAELREWCVRRIRAGKNPRRKVA